MNFSIIIQTITASLHLSFKNKYISVNTLSIGLQVTTYCQKYFFPSFPGHNIPKPFFPFYLQKFSLFWAYYLAFMVKVILKFFLLPKFCFCSLLVYFHHIPFSLSERKIYFQGGGGILCHVEVLLLHVKLSFRKCRKCWYTTCEPSMKIISCCITPRLNNTL